MSLYGNKDIHVLLSKAFHFSPSDNTSFDKQPNLTKQNSPNFSLHNLPAKLNLAPNNLYFSFFKITYDQHKRKSFEHERELRCLVWQAEPIKNAKFSLEKGGIKIKIDLKQLIEKIYISPDSPIWLTILLEDILQKYGLRIPIVNSRLNQLPLY